jgi:nitrogen fixation protein
VFAEKTIVKVALEQMWFGNVVRFLATGLRLVMKAGEE